MIVRGCEVGSRFTRWLGRLTGVSIGGLKLVVDEDLLAVNADLEEAIDAADEGLFGAEHLDVLDVFSLEGEAGEVSGVGFPA